MTRASRSKRCFACGLFGEMLWKNLDSDGAVKPRVARKVYFAHTPRTQRGLDLVASQLQSRY